MQSSYQAGTPRLKLLDKIALLRIKYQKEEKHLILFILYSYLYLREVLEKYEGG